MTRLIPIAIIISVFSMGDAGPNNESAEFILEKEALLSGDTGASLFNPNLPAPKCGTSVIVAINALRYYGMELPASSLENRPDSLLLTFGGSNVLVHYADAGIDTPYQASVDTLPADGVPDYINGIAEIFEYVLDTQTGDIGSGKMGFNPPPSDQGRGGDNRYDIYIVNLGAGYYGYTVPEGIAGQYQIPSFIKLENDFSGTIYSGNPINGVRVTAAHEFFHAIQFGYDALEFDYDDVSNPDTYKPWWMEASAVWAEEAVYDSLNDYLNYLHFFYDYPWMNLGTFSYDTQNQRARAYHPYASCVWPIYLTEKHGQDIVREIWEGCAAVRGYNALHAFDNVLLERSSSLENDFMEFAIWNYHTGPRANPSLYYSESASYPEVIPTANLATPTSEPTALGDFPNPPEHLGANYIVVETGSAAGGVSIVFDGGDMTNAAWHTSVVGYDSAFTEWVDIGVDPFSGFGSIDWYNWDLYDSLVIIPMVSGTTAFYNAYTYGGSIAYDSSLYGDSIVYIWPGDLDNNGIVEEDDILPLAVNWLEIGNSREVIAMNWSPMANQLWGIPAATFADADGSGKVDIRDFLAICLNWNLTHIGTLGYGAQPNDFDIDSHKSVLQIIYEEVKDSHSGPQFEIRLYLEKLLGIMVPDNFILGQNYPNPFNSSTSIEFRIHEKARVRLVIYNLLGQEVKTLVNDDKPEGTYRIAWNGCDSNGHKVASGIYLYRLESRLVDITRKMLIIK